MFLIHIMQYVFWITICDLLLGQLRFAATVLSFILEHNVATHQRQHIQEVSDAWNGPPVEALCKRPLVAVQNSTAYDLTQQAAISLDFGTFYVDRITSLEL